MPGCWTYLEGSFPRNVCHGRLSDQLVSVTAGRQSAQDEATALAAALEKERVSVADVQAQRSKAQELEQVT